jgi:hypothetical protein
MARIYLSATYIDLKDHRAAVSRTLRKMRHDVVGKEDYAAADDRPLNHCRDDVAASDTYVGIFAWRCGFIPPRDNPGKKSITGLEYLEAGKCGKPRLIFRSRKRDRSDKRTRAISAGVHLHPDTKSLYSGDQIPCKPLPQTSRRCSA